MHPADIRKTAICTPFGLFEFRRMLFGLRNAGNTFQRMMDRILAGLSFVFCYLDDIIIASRDEQEHLEHLREVFSWLREAGLVINAEKCVFAATAVEFLGHKVSAAGVEPLRSHVQEVLAHPEPTNISELQAFLGTVNFYRRGGEDPEAANRPACRRPEGYGAGQPGGAAAGRLCSGQGRPGGGHLLGAPFPRFPAQPHGGRLC
jgi:hypothetical protein